MTGDTSARIDDVLALMADTDRRRLLYYLREHGTATRSELADVLTGWHATDRPEGSATDAHRERVASVLYHRHLPALREDDLVDAVGDTDTFVTTDWPQWVDRCLDVAFDAEARDAESEHETQRLDERRE